MDLSDIGRVPVDAQAAARVVPAVERHDQPVRWPDLVAQIGAEIAGPLTAALERINVLTHSGKIDRAGLRALREEVEAARLAGMVGQQLTRFFDRRIRPSPERLSPSELIKGIVNLRTRETVARSLSIAASTLDPVEVVVDAPLLFSMLNATVDWALATAVPSSTVDLAVQARGWPAAARLVCRFERMPREPADVAAASSGPRPARDSLAWWLVEETARALGVELARRADGASMQVTFDFPRRTLPGAGSPDIDDGFALSSNSQPLAGSHVLVIASRRQLRAQIRDALRRMSLIVDFVETIDQAAGFCREGLPHAVVVESIQVGERFAAFRADLLRDVPNFVFVEIVEEGVAFEMSSADGTTMARVGRQALDTSLPSALMFELAPHG